MSYIGEEVLLFFPQEKKSYGYHPSKFITIWFVKEKPLEKEVVRKPHKGCGRVLFLSLQENTHPQNSRDPGPLDD